MTERVIQGFFPGGVRLDPSKFMPIAGAIRCSPASSHGGRGARQVQSKSAPEPRSIPLRPSLVHVDPAPIQLQVAPERPPVFHGGAARADDACPRPLQRFGGDGSFTVDPKHVGLVRSGGKPLPGALRAKMEASFGADFSQVRIHVGPQASRIGALAFTTGNDLYFAPGQYQPDNIKGQQLIGHELAHVIQQRQGRVRAPTGGVTVVQDRALEVEADRLGMKAASAAISHGSNSIISTPPVPAPHPSSPLQRKDRSAAITHLMNEAVDHDQVKLDVIAVCNKVKRWSVNNDHLEKIADNNKSSIGRDTFFYSKWSYFSNFFVSSNVVTVLQSWNAAGAPTSKTVGMLADYALWWKSLNEAKEGYRAYAKGKYGRDSSSNPLRAKRQKAEKLLSAEESATRTKDKTFKHSSVYGALAASQTYSTKAGVSATTAQLLWMLRIMGGVTKAEAKSVAHGLTYYWDAKDSVKHWSGDYHSKFEIMIPLARHLKKFV